MAGKVAANINTLARQATGMDIPGIELVQEGSQLFVRGSPSTDRAVVELPALQALIAQSGCADWHIDSSALEEALQACNQSTSPFVTPIGERKDADIRVEISADAMTATVSLSPPQGGRAASIQDVIRALVEAGVTVGVDHQALLEACQAGTSTSVVAAHGTPPQEGRDSGFVELVEDISDRAPKVGEDGLIDYREYSGVAMVEPGAPLMRRTPAVPGLEGQTVLGEVLAPPPVKDEPFASGLQGAQVSQQDPDLLQATMAGTPVRLPTGVMVEPVLHVAEVNLATGNIRFDGAVRVDGDVIQAMQVHATGDIFVGGTVEGGHLHAGGNITVKGGVIAKAVVEATGSVAARFAESATLHSGTVLALDDSALDCELSSLNQIRVGLKNPQRGRLIGGAANAKLLIAAPVVGSSKSAATRITIGTDPELEARYKALEVRLAQEKANEDNLQKLCRHLVAIKDPKGMLDKAKAAWRQAAQVWGKSLIEKTELDTLRAVMLGARLEVGVATSGPIDLTCGTTRLVLRKEYSKCSIGLDKDGRMMVTGTDGKAFPAA